MEKRFLSPLDVIRVLNREKISFVLVGAYDLSGWRTQSRATEDVEVVVHRRELQENWTRSQAGEALQPIDLLD